MASPTRVSGDGVALIKRWEGLRLEAYQCAGGKWTIGYGHTQTAKAGQKITVAEAEELLKKDLEPVERAVRRHVKVPLTQAQFDALCSFVFNVGVEAFRTSTLLKKLNEGQYDAVPDELMRWVHAGGKRVQGLVNRRAAEAGLWVRGSFVASNHVEVEAPSTLRTDTAKGAMATGAAGLVASLLPIVRETSEAFAALPPWAGVIGVLVVVVAVLVWRARR